MAFIGQSVPHIRKKLQRIEGLQDYTIRDVVRAAEKVYHKRETEDENLEREKKERKEDENRRDRRQEKVLTRILATVRERDKGRRGRQLGNLGDRRYQGPRRPREGRQHLERKQCAYCKEMGHWMSDCLKKKQEVKVLSLGEDEDSEKQGSAPLPKPRVTLEVEGTPVDFLVDTGAEFSVLKTPLGKVKKNEKTLVIGTMGQKSYPWTTS